MRGSRKVFAALAAGAAATALGGASVTQVSAAEKPAQDGTLRFVSRTLQEKQFPNGTFVGVDRVLRDGKLIGYNSLSGRFFQDEERVVVRLGIALRGGVITGRVDAEPVPGQDIVFDGPVLGGSGRFAGITGRIHATLPADDDEGRATVVVHWSR